MRFEFFRKLTVRLVFWNIVGFLLAALLTLLVFERQIRVTLNERLDRQLETKLLEIKEIKASNLDMGLFRSEIEHHSRAMGVNQIFYRLLGPNQEVLAGSDLSSWQGVPLNPVPLAQVRQDEPLWITVRSGSNQPDTRMIFNRLPGGEVVQVGISTAERDQLRTRARLVIAGAMVLVFLLGSLLTSIIVAKTLDGMRGVSKDVVQIARTGDFSQTIPLPTGSVETDNLALTFNSAFGMIGELMHGMEQVLGDIAHDMRTPVTRIRGAAESLLSEPDVTRREEELVGYTIEECDRILGLVNTILEIRAAEAHIMTPHLEELDLAQLVREGVDLFRIMMEDKRLKTTVELPASLPIESDKAYLQRILSNLLDNAIKYTPAGGQVRICLQGLSEKIRLSVEDSGIGVGETERERIFERFYRGDKSRTHPGNGLGLTFCRAVIEAMGGRIFYEAKPGPGSIFTVELPLQFQAKS